jgi:hypothetical protein
LRRRAEAEAEEFVADEARDLVPNSNGDMCGNTRVAVGELRGVDPVARRDGDRVVPARRDAGQNDANGLDRRRLRFQLVVAARTHAPSVLAVAASA